LDNSSSAVYEVPVIYPEVRGTPNLQKHNLPALVWLLDSIIKITQLGKALPVPAALASIIKITQFAESQSGCTYSFWTPS